LEASDVYKLKDPQYVEVFRVAFWSLSANAGGDIKKVKASFSAEPPFIHLEYFDGLWWWTRELWDTCDKWLKACVEGPKHLAEIVEQIVAAADKLKDFDIKADSEGLGMAEKLKAATKFGKNSAALASNAAKLKELQPILTKAVADLKVIGPQLKDLVGKADEVGKQAAADKLEYPTAIFEKFHKGERKTKAEIDNLTSEQAKFNGGKKKETKEEKKEEKKVEKELEKEKKAEKKDEKKK